MRLQPESSHIFLGARSSHGNHAKNPAEKTASSRPTPLDLHRCILRNVAGTASFKSPRAMRPAFGRFAESRCHVSRMVRVVNGPGPARLCSGRGLRCAIKVRPRQRRRSSHLPMLLDRRTGVQQESWSAAGAGTNTRPVEFPGVPFGRQLLGVAPTYRGLPCAALSFSPPFASPPDANRPMRRQTLSLRRPARRLQPARMW